jgi:hypothetical protein
MSRGGAESFALHPRTKRPFISLNSLKRPKKWTLLNAPWTFAQRWRSEMMGEICDADESPLQEFL